MLAELEKFYQSVELTFDFAYFYSITKSHDSLHAKNKPEVMHVAQKFAAHWMDDKPVAFLIAGVAVTNMNIRSFFPRQASAFFHQVNAVTKSSSAVPKSRI